MKKLRFPILIIVALVTVFFTGCRNVVIGSGDPKTRVFDYSGITSIEAQNGFAVEIIQSSSFNIEVTTDDNIWDYLNVKKSGETLIVNLDWNRSYVSVMKKAVIAMPDLESIKLSGGSVGTISGSPSPNQFEARLSGGSVLNGELETEDTEIYLSGGSIITLTGTGGKLMVDSSGGSKANLNDFVVTDSNISISGGGKADVTMNGVLDADLSGGSRIFYSGNVEIGDLDISGGSSIHKR